MVAEDNSPREADTLAAQTRQNARCILIAFFTNRCNNVSDY